MAEITKVNLLSVPLEKDYAHTLYFESANAQYNYFNGKKKKEYTNFSFQRHDNTIRVPEHIDDLLAAGCNYVMYQNPSYANKWFYAFIVGMEYKNEGCTIVTIRTDCIQTWMFDVAFKPTFIEREHVISDEIGEHTIEEGLDTGEYIVNNRYSLTTGDTLMIVVAVAKNAEGEQETGYFYNGIYSGLRYYAFPATSDSKLQEFLEKYDSEGIGESINCMFLAPAALAATEGNVSWAQPIPETWKPHTIRLNKATGQTSDAEVVQEFSKTYIDNHYVPRNKKLMCYPYRYLLVTNNAGSASVYKFELFFDEGAGTGERPRHPLEPSFTLETVLTPGCSGRLYPVKYNGAAVNYEEGLTMGKFPILNWASDAFTNWMTQNSVNQAINIATGLGQIGVGAAMAVGAIATGGLTGITAGGTIVSGVTQIASTISQIREASFAPPNIKGNLNAGDAITAMGKNEFDFYVMSVKNEHAKKIDEYFDMYGYKCHRVKIPYENHRKEYWYTKTIDANITGAIPQDDLQTIKDCYNRGITFWRNPQNFRDYSVLNPILAYG
jgi:hypothetical protein